MTFQQFHNAEQEDAVLSIPILHIQMFPLKFFLTRRRKFCSRIGNGELSGERRKQLVTKFLQCLSVKQSSVKLLPTIKFPSVLGL